MRIYISKQVNKKIKNNKFNKKNSAWKKKSPWKAESLKQPQLHWFFFFNIYKNKTPHCHWGIAGKP